jgi:hypothetical protein
MTKYNFTVRDWGGSNPPNIEWVFSPNGAGIDIYANGNLIGDISRSGLVTFSALAAGKYQFIQLDLDKIYSNSTGVHNTP